MENELIIGGSGFIGINLAHTLLQKGKEVVIFDNFSRKGTRENFKWLEKEFPSIELVEADIRNDIGKLQEAIKRAKNIYHMAAQVAVTTSIKDPKKDFEINALGTLNVLESIRKTQSQALLIFASTNKVYGELIDEPVIEKEKRYEFEKLTNGINEQTPLDFHSPYGCSKGCADQYVRDYSRIYGLNTVVMRQSCIYGPRQFGIEDQGWIAWFTIATMLKKPLTIYGNGKQVRDVLNVEDLINVIINASSKPKKVNGQIYNIGGGIKNSLSLLELLDILEVNIGEKISYNFSKPRLGDQVIYISDISKVQKELNWDVKIDFKKGINKLIEWTIQNKEEIKSVLH